jgi:hypothetical protein
MGRVHGRGRKGWLPAFRDATRFKIAYSFGLRRNETRMLDVVDFGRNPEGPEFGEFGVCNVRHGKAMRGSPPKRRSVLAVWPWTVEILAQWTGDLPVAASLAKAYCSEAFFRVAAETIQVHGGIGFTWEHDAHLFFERAKASELLLGGPTYHRELLAQRIGISGRRTRRPDGGTIGDQGDAQADAGDAALLDEAQAGELRPGRSTGSGRSAGPAAPECTDAKRIRSTLSRTHGRCETRPCACSRPTC